MTTQVVDVRTESMIDHARSRFDGRRAYFIGIGGCGMSGLARLARAAGAHVEGSDNAPSEFTDRLIEDGFTVHVNQADGQLSDGTDLVVASAAIKPDHPELRAAAERGIESITYAQALGRLQASHTGISIAGTHGKSTTTAMLAHVLICAGLDPSFIVGAVCAQIGGGSRTGAATIPHGPLAGQPGLLLGEACEFNRSFHHHQPRIALINNIEADHLDIYGSLEAVIEAFAQFAGRVPHAREGGRLLIAHDGAHRREITAGLDCEIETFGFNPMADWVVTYAPDTCTVTIARDGEALAEWRCAMPGEHNALNAAAAAIIASWCGASWEQISAGLDTFRGVDRRMQLLGTRAVGDGSVTVYDDYGHHPTEIEATLKALRAVVQPRRLICVFQPHQHSRTRFLLEEFANAFSSADVVIVPHIYFVRDSEIERSRVRASDLVDRLLERGVAAMHVYPFEAIVNQLNVMCRPDDLLVIMGAGPVWQIGHRFLHADVGV